MKKLLILTIFLTLFVTACPKKKTDVIGNSKFKHSSKTAKGAAILSHTPITLAQRTAIDDGLDDTFRIASNDPYNLHEKWNPFIAGWGFRQHPHYAVRLIERSPQCKTPAFLIEYRVNNPGENYDQTEFDKDPRAGHVALCAAGALGLTPDSTEPVEVVMRPDMAVVSDASILRKAAKYEAEHAMLMETDRAMFEATLYHVNVGHPILPDPITGALASEEMAAVRLTGFCVRAVD